MLRSFTLFSVLIALFGFSAYADDNVTFNYQGRILANNQPVEGSSSIKLAIVTTSGTVTLWSNDDSSVGGSEPTTALPIQVRNGVFDIAVGDTATGMEPLPRVLFNGRNDHYLRVWLNDGANGFQVLTPDYKIQNAQALALQEVTTPLNLFVNGTTGSDANSGLKANAAKKTIQAAVNIVPQMYSSTVTIKIANGTYRESVFIENYKLGRRNASGAYFNLVGDESTVPSDSTDPLVRITGSDNDVNRVRSFGILVGESTGVQIRGITTDLCSAYGFAIFFSGCRLINCKAENNTFDGIIGSQGELNFINTVATSNGREGFNFNQFAHVVMDNCTASSNAENGILASRSTVEMWNGGDKQSNQANGIWLKDQSIAINANSMGQNLSNNSDYGLRVSYDSHIQNENLNTYSGNGLGDSLTEFGGNLY